MTRTLAPLLVTLALAACGPWPDLPAPEGEGRDAPWPLLLPSSKLNAAGSDGPTDPVREAQALEGRAEALRRRASVLRAPVDDQDAFEALRARIDG